MVTSHNHKMDNDDLDVTKGVKITVTISEEKSTLPLNQTPQKPYTFGRAKLFAGEGVGVVTKDGLKPPKGYPAINPTPLKEMKRCYELLGDGREIFISVSIENGEEIAKQTANAKVGVVGGLSILGSSGFVKPVSNEAFLRSIEVEIKVAIADGFERVVLTLGNSSLKMAEAKFHQTQIVEIGNFIYDSLSLAQALGVKKVTLIVGIAKALKIAQGFKNTHNRFGSIDFKALEKLLQTHLKISIDTNSTKTLKGVLAQLKKQGLEGRAREIISQSCQSRLQSWFGNLEIELITI